MRIWDVQTHLRFPGGNLRIRMDTIVGAMDRMGIERVILFMGLPGKVAGKPSDVFRARRPSPADFQYQNREVRRAMKYAGERALGFAYVNPQYVEESLKEMDRHIHNGPMLGIQLWTAVNAEDSRLDPIVERATELDAVVHHHTWYKVGGTPRTIEGGVLERESTSGDIADLASRHPNATIIDAHTGGDWELGERAIEPYENIYAAVSGGYSWADQTQALVQRLGPKRVIYGSDAPGRSFAAQLAKVYGADIPKDEKELVFGGNLRRLLRPIMERKGLPMKL